MLEPSDRLDLTVIVFSKDRPLQLHATLASLWATCQDADRLRVRVLVYASDDAMAARYQRVAEELPWAELIGEDGFQATLLAAVAGSRHLAFVVDDCLFVRSWRAASAVALLERAPEVLGVSLRLGRNTTWCYTLDRIQPPPTLVAAGDGWLAFDWTRAQADFGYPLEVSSSVYRAEDVLPLLEALAYRNPNELEVALAGQGARFASRRPAMACSETSLAFCAPVNVVQTSFANRAGTHDDLSPAALGRRFDEGVRVEVARLMGFTPNACHQEIELPLARATPRSPTSPPTVSVVIPCYAQAEYLQLAVHSLAVQTFTDWEAIVVDDGSPDDTAEVVRALAASLPGRRIRLLRQANAGLANARNAAIRAARGRYVLPLDADDALCPDHLARTVAALEADPALDIAGTDVAVFGARTGVWSMQRPFEFTVERAFDQTPLPYASLYRREVWEKVGGYRPNMSAGYEDWDFWIGAAELGCRAALVEEPLLLYREKQSSMLTAARLHDTALRARLVLNHPSHFTPEYLAVAETALARSPLPPPKPSTVATEVDLAAPGASAPAAAASPRAAPSALGPPSPVRPLRIGFLLIGTNRYAAFFPPLRESLRQHLAIPGAEPHFFLFTNVDAPGVAAADTTVLRVDHLPWPLITLLRYKVFLEHAPALKGMDYLYYMDVDCLAVGTVGPELLGRLVATSHPGYHGKSRAAFTYETRPTSRACIGPQEGTRYYAGGLQGGEREAYLALARSAHAAICDDLARNVIAVWHDESHLNRYLVDHPPTVVLDPSYLYPESWQLPFPRRILALDKDHAAIRAEGAPATVAPQAATASVTRAAAGKEVAP